MGLHRLRSDIVHAMGPATKEAIQRKNELKKSRAADIYKKFASDDADFQVNLKSDVSSKITKRLELEDVDYDLYRAAKTEIYDLMQTDIYARFRKSKRLRKCLTTLVYMVILGMTWKK